MSLQLAISIAKRLLGAGTVGIIAALTPVALWGLHEYRANRAISEAVTAAESRLVSAYERSALQAQIDETKRIAAARESADKAFAERDGKSRAELIEGVDNETDRCAITDDDRSLLDRLYRPD